MTRPDWIAIEFGSVRMLQWDMRGNDVLARHERAPLPLNALADAVPQEVPVVVSGAPGAALAVPCRPAPPCRSGGFLLLPGVKQAQPYDTMEAEVTRIAGFLALNPGFDGTICLPGPTSRWVQISAGEIVSFRSVLTGTLLTLLQAPQALGALDDGFDADVLREAVDRALGRPAALTCDLATLRAGILAGGAEGAGSRALGWLIGVELAATRPWWLGQNVALLADGQMGEPYRIALEAQGVPALIADGPRMALEGLKRARAM
ncbi:hypothetical protein AL035_11900 [Salipiger aestuarii]|uniref:2-dehydro-3-deoxygalactonokinase n=1 Tax=Salipiger aestuarii TaxID=568098 RepID=A0A327XYT5_9RHOB|nr:2-dehydro-3-deoxygalactonokinase [Salipiger aestuarii]EIE49831.1 2-dehydro-3-deoxygalactonokinase, putative [Citreicella sp. 357]KAB2541537.1 hypothetical protein AL035_11900 [Salipiger aestuarii]RAK14148.1 2-dehydro-3-deoxygalactonokinase [Salipiger aestuarii]